MGRFPGSEIPAPPSRARGEIYGENVLKNVKTGKTVEEHTG
jgi:hypothetical protein